MESVKGIILSYDYSADLIAKWIKIALIANMPMIIFEIVPNYSSGVFQSPNIWTDIHIAKDLYPEVFKRINYLIDKLNYSEDRIRNERIKNIYRLYTLIRYGPELPDVFEIFRRQYSYFPSDEKLDLCRCASLANKMDLLDKLLPDVMPILMSNPNLSQISFNEVNEDCIEMHKFMFDILAKSDEPFRQTIYWASRILNVFYRYYRVTFIRLNGNNLNMEFKMAIDANKHLFPESFKINLESISKDNLKSILDELIFDNAEILEPFLVDLFSALADYNYSNFSVNSENLKSIINSESIRQMINYHIENLIIPPQPFTVSLDDLLRLQVDFDPSFVKFAKTRINLLNISFLHKLRLTSQLEWLESLLGHSVSTLLKPRYDYFKFRHFYKYLIENGKELPEDLSERTRELLRIDYPSLQI